MTYHQIFDEKNIKGTISGAETVYLFEVLEFTLVVWWGLCCSIFSFLCSILYIIVVFLACRHDITEKLLKVALNTITPPFSFSQCIVCLSFCDLCLQITPLVSSNFSVHNTKGDIIYCMYDATFVLCILWIVMSGLIRV